MFQKHSILFLIALFVSITLNTTVPIPMSITVLAQNDAIYFEDPNLKFEILKIIGKSEDEIISQQDVQKIKNLDLSAKNISSLEGIQYFENLGMLKLSDNHISDLSPLVALKKIDFLLLNNNRITDITPLSELKALTLLNISDNQITDISPLENLANLTYLYFANNNVSDISMLGQLKEFDLIEFSNNHISDISVLKDFPAFRHGLILNQTIELPAQQVKEGDTVTITNSIKDKDGFVKDITVKDGYYDEKTNTIVWQNVKGSQTLSYTFNKIINVSKYGDIEFSGTVFTEVTVFPNQKPVLSGVVDKEISVGESFNPLENVSAFDEEDGNITNQIKIEGEVDNTKEGQYELIYSVTDSASQTTTATRVITVVDESKAINQSPMIDASDRILKVGDTFNPLEGVSAFDLEDGDLTHKIEVTSNNVDTTKAGTYEVTYKVMDSQRAEITLTIIVMVREIPQTGYILPLGYGLTLLVGSSLILYREKRQS